MRQPLQAEGGFGLGTWRLPLPMGILTGTAISTTHLEAVLLHLDARKSSVYDSGDDFDRLPLPCCRKRVSTHQRRERVPLTAAADKGPEPDVVSLRA